MAQKRAKNSKKVIKTRIISNKKIAEDHYVIKIDTKGAMGAAVPGQFVNVRIDNKATDPLLRIPLGIHEIKKKSIALLYKVVGTGTKLLSEKRQGEHLDVLGPLGKGFEIIEQKKAILVAGGHGVAPLYALAERLKRKKIKTSFFIGASTKQHIVSREKIRKLGIKVHVATEDGSAGYKGYVTRAVKKHLKDFGEETTIYACGPKPMLRAISSLAKQGRMRAQVSVDEYMACGIGVCLGCAIKTTGGYKYVCKDGPVFDATEILWGKPGE